MASCNAAPPPAIVRQALREQVAATSLRHVSRQVGMSPTGLQKLLDGAHPYSATRRKLERWFVVHGPGRLQGPLRGASALTLLHVLVRDLSPARHRTALELLLASLESAYRAARIPEPGWLEELRVEMRA